MTHRTLHRRTAFLSLALAAMIGFAPVARAADDNTVYLDTKDGRVTIELRPDLAPQHVAQLKTLIKKGFYDGLKFHRVMDGFMAQTGDPKGNGTGGSSLPNIPAEFSQSPFRRGTLGMARSSDPNSANSQFFICLGDAPFLNGQYTVIGLVSSGMDVVDKIKKAAAGAPGGAVQNPDKIVKMQMAPRREMSGGATVRRPTRLAVVASAVAIPFAAAFAGAALAASGLPLTPPASLRSTVQAPEGGIATSPANTLQELYPRLAACWEIPQGLAGFPRTEITARFALRRDGSVIGEPRITFSMQNADQRGRDIPDPLDPRRDPALHAGRDHAGARRRHRGAPDRPAVHLPRSQGQGV